MARRSRHLPLRPIVAIYCEGESEQQYFEMLKRKYHAANVHARRIEVHAVKMTGLRLLEQARRDRDYAAARKQVDETYVVFDRDDLRSADLVACAQYAKVHRLSIVFSSVNFEVWILMHYQRVERVYTPRELNRRLTQAAYLGRDYAQFKGQPYDTYLFDRVRVAEANAAALRTRSSAPWHERDPYTTVDQAIVAIFGVAEWMPR